MNKIPSIKGSILIVTLLFFRQSTVFAQFSDSVHHYIGLFATGTINKTNTASTYLANQSGKFSIKKEKMLLNLSANWVYGQQQKKPTNNDVSAAFNCDMNLPLRNTYYWGLATYTSSYSLKIVNQFQAGAGFAADAINRSNLVLNLSDGVLYEQSDIYLRDTIREQYNTFRNSAKVIVRWKLNETIRLNSTTFLQNSLSKSSDYIFKTTNGLDIKLVRWLLLNCTYAYNKYDRTGKENTLFTYGLKIEHYF